MQMKKNLTRLKLINWHYFSHETITLKNINLFSGENGAGKSTILDAIQLVLTTNTRKFNLATNADSNRNLKSYVRGKTGEEGVMGHAKCENGISRVMMGLSGTHRNYNGTYTGL